MSLNYQVNIAISAGCDFVQEYTLAEANLLPMNITGFNFDAAIGKHSRPLDAVKSTSTEPCYKFTSFTTRVVDGVNGVYAISLTKDQTTNLEEGKYFYNVVVNDANGATREVVSGLAFVTVSLASVSSQQQST